MTTMRPQKPPLIGSIIRKSSATLSEFNSPRVNSTRTSVEVVVALEVDEAVAAVSVETVAAAEAASAADAAAVDSEATATTTATVEAEARLEATVAAVVALVAAAAAVVVDSEAVAVVVAAAVAETSATNAAVDLVVATIDLLPTNHMDSFRQFIEFFSFFFLTSFCLYMYFICGVFNN